MSDNTREVTEAFIGDSYPGKVYLIDKPLHTSNYVRGMADKQDKEWKKILAEYLRKLGILRSGTERIEIHCNDNNIATIKTLEKHN